MESGVFRKTENQVHVLDGLAGSAFDQVIYHTDNVELPSMFTDIQNAFVGIDDHLHVRIGVNHMDEWLVFVVILVDLDGRLFRKVAIEIDRLKNTAGEITAYGNEIHLAGIIGRQCLEGLAYFT